MIDPRDVAELRRIIRKVDTISGPGVLNTLTGITIDPNRKGGKGRTPVRFVAVIRLTAPEDGGGNYVGTLLGPPTTIRSDNTTVSQDDIGTNLGITVRAINFLERDRDTHDITFVEGDRPKDFLAIFLGSETDGDLRQVWGFFGFQVSDCEGTNSLTI